MTPKQFMIIRAYALEEWKAYCVLYRTIGLSGDIELDIIKLARSRAHNYDTYDEQYKQNYYNARQLAKWHCSCFIVDLYKKLHYVPIGRVRKYRAYDASYITRLQKWYIQRLYK